MRSTRQSLMQLLLARQSMMGGAESSMMIQILTCVSGCFESMIFRDHCHQKVFSVFASFEAVRTGISTNSIKILLAEHEFENDAESAEGKPPTGTNSKESAAAEEKDCKPTAAAISGERST